jgi:hypothetical protein
MRLSVDALEDDADVHLLLQYIALQVLEKLIQTRWKALPAEQQTGELGKQFIACLSPDIGVQVFETSSSRSPWISRRMRRGCGERRGT